MTTPQAKKSVMGNNDRKWGTYSNYPKYLDGQVWANSVDTHQTAPLQHVNYCMVKSYCSNFRVIIPIFFRCPIFLGLLR